MALSHKIAALVTGLSFSLGTLSQGVALAQEQNGRPTKEQFRSPHQRAVDEARFRDDGNLSEPRLGYEQLVSLIQQKIKYVFVFYQENRSFDSYFGTFPGAE